MGLVLPIAGTSQLGTVLGKPLPKGGPRQSQMEMVAATSADAAVDPTPPPMPTLGPVELVRGIWYSTREVSGCDFTFEQAVEAGIVPTPPNLSCKE